MTINQSRYGGLAEVGRAPVSEKKKDSRRPYVTMAGGGLAVGGGLVAGDANRRLPQYKAAHNELRSTAEKARWKYNIHQSIDSPTTHVKLFRHDVRVGLNGPNKEVGPKFYENQLKRIDEGANKAKKFVNRTRNVRSAGLAALAAGVGIAGMSGYAHEKSRGTLGYKRSHDASGPTASSSFRRMNGM